MEERKREGKKGDISVLIILPPSHLPFRPSLILSFRYHTTYTPIFPPRPSAVLSFLPLFRPYLSPHALFFLYLFFPDSLYIPFSCPSLHNFLSFFYYCSLPTSLSFISSSLLLLFHRLSRLFLLSFSFLAPLFSPHSVFYPLLCPILLTDIPYPPSLLIIFASGELFSHSLPLPPSSHHSLPSLLFLFLFLPFYLHLSLPFFPHSLPSNSYTSLHTLPFLPFHRPSHPCFIPSLPFLFFLPLSSTSPPLFFLIFPSLPFLIPARPCHRNVISSASSRREIIERARAFLALQ